VTRANTPSLPPEGPPRGGRRRPALLGGLLIVLLVLVVLAGAGCGGGSESSGVANVETEGGNAPAETTTPSTEETEQAMLRFAQCMRDQGIDYPDPAPDANGNLRLRPPTGNVDQEQLESAQEACQEHLEGVIQPRSEEDETEFQDALLKYARCMRDNGVDVPDPPAASSDFGAFREQIDRNDPQFQSANEECQRYIADVVGRAQGGGG
jgi:hypothetical protein